jgi:hypothetical protein
MILNPRFIRFGNILFPSVRGPFVESQPRLSVFPDSMQDMVALRSQAGDEWYFVIVSAARDKSLHPSSSIHCYGTCITIANRIVDPQLIEGLTVSPYSSANIDCQRKV